MFSVTIEYTFPASLEAVGAEDIYTWDPEAGKYTKSDSSTPASYELSNEGAFEIKVTNQSNVDIEYTVTYTANPNAVFASAVNGDMVNDTDIIETIAAGQTAGEDGISITDAAAATTGNTDFNSKTCTGNLTVSGVNSGKTPSASGTDTLGTFTVNIKEPVLE